MIFLIDHNLKGHAHILLGSEVKVWVARDIFSVTAIAFPSFQRALCPTG